MRILHILNDVTGLGNGIVNTAVDLAIEQARMGHSVSVVSAGGEYEPLLHEHNVAHIHLDQSRSLRTLPRAVFSLHGILRDFQPDLIHAHMRTGLLLCWLLSPFHRIPLVAHLHNIHDRGIRLMGRAHRVIAVSASVAKSIALHGVASSKIRVALNRTLGSRRTEPLRGLVPVALSRPAILAVGGLNHRKGIADLLLAFDQASEEFPDAHLYLVGDGPERSLFELQTKGLASRAHIHFEGFQNAPQRYMLAADIFVLPSRRESFGLVLIEAREAGCAIVSSDVDGTSEALDGGTAGILIPPEDVPTLATTLLKLLKNDEERSAWQRQAKQGIDKFRVHQMAIEVEDIYEGLLQEQGKLKARSPVVFGD